MPLIRNVTAQALTIYHQGDAGADSVEPGMSIEVEDPSGYVASGMWALDAPSAPPVVDPSPQAPVAETPEEG